MAWLTLYAAIALLYGASCWYYLHSFEFWKMIIENHPDLNREFKRVRSEGYLDTILLLIACLLGLFWIVFIFFDLRKFVRDFSRTKE